MFALNSLVRKPSPVKSQTIDDLIEDFNVKVTGIRIALEIRQAQGGTAKISQHLLQKIYRDILSLKSSHVEMKAQVASAKEELKKTVEMRKNITEMNKEIDYMMSNIPQHLPQMVVSGGSAKSSSTESSVGGDSTYSHSAQTPKKKKPTLSVPTIQYITLEEFDSIPKYMKGRTPYEAMNIAIDNINTSIAFKYRLLGKARSLLGSNDMKKYRAFKAQETNETTGLYFCTMEDLKSHPGFKLENTAKTILTCFRHTCRIREVRGPGTIVRYAIIQ